MLSLLELQNLFAESLETGEVSSKLLEQVYPNPALASSDRVLVYRKHSREGHYKSLFTTFPAIEKLLGSHNFKMLSSEYWKKVGPRFQSLHDYGSLLPAYLKELIQTVPQLEQFPFLPELAKLEWNMWKVFTTNVKELRMDCDYPVDQLRRELLSNAEPTPVEKAPLTLSISKKGANLLIERLP